MIATYANASQCRTAIDFGRKPGVSQQRSAPPKIHISKGHVRLSVAHIYIVPKKVDFTLALGKRNSGESKGQTAPAVLATLADGRIRATAEELTAWTQFIPGPTSESSTIQCE